MLTEERFAKILSILEHMGSVTVQQLMTELDASESTVRRDLNMLRICLTSPEGNLITQYLPSREVN